MAENDNFVGNEAVDAPVTDQTPQSTDQTPQSEQPTADGQAEELIAGKFKTQDDLVKSCKELETKLGNYKETEAKASEYDALAEYLNMVGQPAQNVGGNVQEAPEQAYTEQDFETRLAQKEQEIMQRVQLQLRTRDEVAEAERLYPELKTDSTYRELVAGQLVINPKKTVKDAAKTVAERLTVVKAQGAKAEIEKVSEKQQAFIEGTRKASAPSDVDNLRQKAEETGDWTAYLKEANLK